MKCNPDDKLHPVETVTSPYLIFKVLKHYTTNTLYNIYKTPINKNLDYTSDLVVFLQDSGFTNTYSTSLKTDDLTTTLSFWNVLYNKGEGPINDCIPTYYGNGTEWIKFKG